MHSWLKRCLAILAALPLANHYAGAQNAEAPQRQSPTPLAAVSQAGKNADEIKKSLERIKLPPGFKIALYAIVPDARHMAVAANGVTFAGTRKDKVWAVTARHDMPVAGKVKPFAPSIEFKIPNGVCLSNDGNLFVVEQNRILAFAAAGSEPDPIPSVVVKQGGLIPPPEESSQHTARVCRIGPDNRLYVTLGQPYDVPPPEKSGLYNRLGMGGIIRMDRDGRDREVYARGVRDSVGLAFNPANGELWFTDTQVDGMGDDIPPGELNRQTAMGQNFGFPWYGGGRIRTREYMDQHPPDNLVFPAVEMAAHAADLGLTFYTGDMFPAGYRGGIFNAEHGSRERTKPIGARIMFTSVRPDGSTGETKVFADGWLDPETDTFHGKPVDVAQLPDGSLLVSDDLAGAIYRIWYES
jgi:glucose/arabinose dehydrogenase